MKPCIKVLFFLYIASLLACDGDRSSTLLGNDDDSEKSSSLEQLSSSAKSFASDLLSSSNESLSYDHDVKSSSFEQSSSSANSSTSELSSSSKESLSFDDEMFPYAGIPRIVIETVDMVDVVDRENEIPAKFQIFGEKDEESEILEMSIRGRGNSSWTAMPKKSYKIEFAAKKKLLGMPQNKDWALIANYADKTLMKNYLMYNAARELNSFYSPRCEFVELYLNRDFLGTYLLVETIKSGKNRVDFSKSTDAYIVEVDAKLRQGEQYFVSDVLNDEGKVFKIHEPHNASDLLITQLSNHIREFETYLIGIEANADNQLGDWIDVDDMIKYMWIQEFTKNPDANFYTSVFFCWEKNDVIKMGPVWDFDLAFGGHYNESASLPFDWRSAGYWYEYMLKDCEFVNQRKRFWDENKLYFESIVDSVDVVYDMLKESADNNFRRWNVLESTENKFHPKSYHSYRDAVDDLKVWIKERLAWIDANL